MKLFTAFAALAGCAILATAPASAAVVDFTDIKATWFDVVSLGGPAPSFSGNGTANASARWGTSTGFGQSGYDFDTIAIPQLTVNPPGGSATTNIGVFRHVNQPINGGTSISSAKLRLTTNIFVDGNYLDTVDFVYFFDHDETTNSANPCAYGGANGQGVNINGCADRVLSNFNGQSEFFTIDGYNYALDVVGFLVDGNPVTNFLTQERAVNEAFMRGRLVLHSQAIPEPATWAMMISGFGLVGFAARRRRAIETVNA